MVELTRGWNSRLGFSLQGDGHDTYISAIYADSVAAKDGRLQAGDQVIMVMNYSLSFSSNYHVNSLLASIIWDSSLPGQFPFKCSVVLQVIVTRNFRYTKWSYPLSRILNMESKHG
jgi:hypothetical protein